MDLASQVRSRFRHVDVRELEGRPDAIEVVFAPSGASVWIVCDPDLSRYSVSYPKKGSLGSRVEEGFSENLVSAGVFWILKQVQKYGYVRSEY